ncbi:MAG: pyridoxine 5-phosphate synthase, partial [Leptospirillum sp. Group IV 'UBA BS']
LGVNIDQVATLRQARGEFDPDPLAAAHLARLAGADQIVLHVREDRRHANEHDLRRIRETASLPVNLEMALTEEMADLALTLSPDRVTLVPEKRNERTTEGGLVLTSDYLKSLDLFSERCAKRGVRVSLFMDPDPEMLGKIPPSGVDQVELHTGPFARSFGTPREEEEFGRLILSATLLSRRGLVVAAGHGLTPFNLPRVLDIPGLAEVNIGHSIIARAVLFGLREAVSEVKTLLFRTCDGGGT